MAEMLIELGCEELPASFVRKAYTDLRDKIGQAIVDSKLGSGDDLKVLGTPRRLIVSASGLRDRQDDEVKQVRGPALRAAYDAEGNPTNALLGFCRSNGIDPAGLTKDEQYVWFQKTVPGRAAIEVLAEALPAAIRSLTFEKTMRWGSSRMRFARPIRWILASLNGSLIEFEVEGVASGLTSRGHRFYSPEPFPAATYGELIEGLRSRHVEPDPDVRHQRLVVGALRIAEGTPDLTDALVEENVFLTEWPTAIRGTFRDEFMSLPEPVLITAMAKHEKMFPIRDEEGKLTNGFVFVRNSGEDETVRKGAQWVLNARFNDAKFFFDEDLKFSLKDFLDRTAGILFQEKLGTVRARADRLASLAETIARATGATEEETALSHQAGLYAKADLSSGLVSELSSLQGIVGGEYARREGMAGAVAWAIATQYDPSKNTSPADCSGERISLRLVMADALDKLAGYLGLGLEPSGSKDPYGLRRAASVLIEAAWAWPSALPSYDPMLDAAFAAYQAQGVELDVASAKRSICEIFKSRYSALMPDVRYDILEAAVLADSPEEAVVPRSVRLRVRVLGELSRDVTFVQTATRPLNILADARKKGIEFGTNDPLGRLEHSALESAEGLDLFQQLKDQEETLFKAVRQERVGEVIRLVKDLAQPINLFFENNMVMADQPEVRYARLTLLNAAAQQLRAAGDFTRLVFEG
jgi:glycyl-tRNA synthetase beta chain